MEDKKVMEFIQKHHDEVVEQDKIRRKKQKKLNRIKDIIFYLVMIVSILVLLNVLKTDSKKAMAKCLNNGYSYNYCLKDTN